MGRDDSIADLQRFWKIRSAPSCKTSFGLFPSSRTRLTIIIRMVQASIGAPAGSTLVEGNRTMAQHILYLAYTSTHLLYVFGQFCSMLICIFAVREAGLHEFIECDVEHGFDAMTLTVQNSSVNMELPA